MQNNDERRLMKGDVKTEREGYRRVRKGINVLLWDFWDIFTCKTVLSSRIEMSTFLMMKKRCERIKRGRERDKENNELICDFFRYLAVVEISSRQAPFPEKYIFLMMKNRCESRKVRGIENLDEGEVIMYRDIYFYLVFVHFFYPSNTQA
jgi:hypothetical protein